MLKKKYVWEKVTERLESEIPKSESKTWLSHTTLQKLDADMAVIEVPNKFVANWLRDNYLSSIRDSFESILNFLPKIRFVYAIPLRNKNKPNFVNSSQSMPIFDHRLNPLLTFSNFISSPGNQFPYASALEAANNPGRKYNPIYMFSKLCFGKTHLLNAIGNHILKKTRFTKVKYITADQFSSDFAVASKTKKLGEFRESYRNIDVLLLDDIHLFGPRGKTQRELTSLFSFLYESKKQMIVSGQSAPCHIPNLQPQLRSRMEGGLLFELHGPDQETRIKIIKKKAKEDNIELPDDVIFFLANSTSDLKALMQYLVSIYSHTSLYQRKIDLSAVKSIIMTNRLFKKSIHEIQKLTAQYYNITLPDLLSNKKTRNLSYPRHMAMYLSRKLTNLSFKEIGKAFGNKHHTTIIHAVNLIDKHKGIKNSVLQDIDKLQNYLVNDY